MPRSPMPPDELRARRNRRHHKLQDRAYKECLQSIITLWSDCLHPGKLHSYERAKIEQTRLQESHLWVTMASSQRFQCLGACEAIELVTASRFYPTMVISGKRAIVPPYPDSVPGILSPYGDVIPWHEIDRESDAVRDVGATMGRKS